MAVCFILFPFTFVHVAGRLNEAAIALAHPFIPHAFIDAAICVVYRSQAMFYHLSAAKSSGDQKLTLELVP